MDSREKIAGDLSSQQMQVNELREKLKRNESMLRGKENEFAELQTKFNKIKFLKMSKSAASSSSSAESTPNTATTAASTAHSTTSDDKTTPSSSTADAMSESAYRGKLLLLKKQLEESRSLIDKQETEKNLMKREIDVLKEKQLRFDEDVEIIDSADVRAAQQQLSGDPYSSGGGSGATSDSVNELFAQIVYKDTKIMEMNQHVCDLEARIMDLQENIKGQNEVLHARNRAIKLLLSQQQSGDTLSQSKLNFEEIVEREEERERIEKLKERVAELEMEKGNLQLRVMELEGTNGSKPPLIDIELERDALRAERDELKVKCKEIIAKFDTLELQNDKIMTDKETLLSKVRQLEDVAMRLETERERLKTQISELDGLNAMKSKNEEFLARDLQRVKSDLLEKQSEADRAIQQLSEFARKSKSIVSEKESVIAELRLELDQRSEQVLHEKDEIIEETRQELEKIKNENWSLANLVQELRDESTRIQNTLKAAKEDAETRLSELRSDMSATVDAKERERLDCVESVTNELNRLVAENSELKSSIEEKTRGGEELIESLRQQNSELTAKIDSLGEEKLKLENEFRYRLTILDEELSSQTNALSSVTNQRCALSEQLDIANNALELERQRKREALEMMEKLQSEKYAENELILDKDRQIEALQSQRDSFDAQINEQKLLINEFYRKQDETSSLVSDLEVELIEKSKAFEQLESQLTQNQSTLTNKDAYISELENEITHSSARHEEARIKNETLATQLEQLIVLSERENREKEELRELVTKLQLKTDEETDFVRDKDLKINSLQQELRQQVEDMKEIEDMVSEKQTEIDRLSEQTEFVRQENARIKQTNEELQASLKVLQTASQSADDNDAYVEEINRLTDENMSLKTQLEQSLAQYTSEYSDKLDELCAQISDRDSTISELTSELRDAVSRVHIDDSRHQSEIECLRNELSEVESRSQTIIENSGRINLDHQTSIDQLNATIDEYKKLFNELRTQIDRLEAEKLSAIQETNQINQVLETERERQSRVVGENYQLRNQISQMESHIESLGAHNQQEYQTAQNDTIVQLNQTIDGLVKENYQLKSELDTIRVNYGELQTNKERQSDELQQRLEFTQKECNDRLIEANTAINALFNDKEAANRAYYDLENNYKQLELQSNNKDTEIAKLSELESSNQKLNEALTNLNHEKMNVLKLMLEKENEFEKQRKDCEQFRAELTVKEESLAYKEKYIGEIDAQISSLTETNQNLEKSCDEYKTIEAELSARVTELEQKLESIERSPERMSVSELQYELDILRQNYNMEIDSFNTTVNERESMVEKLQKQINSLKKRIVKHEDQLREQLEKEAFLKKKLDESQGMIKYEQMQRQSETDSRIAELKKQLEDSSNSYQFEIMNLNADKSNLMAMESELRRKLNEVQKTMHDMGVRNYEKEINEYRAHVESLVQQLESERIEKREAIMLYDSKTAEQTFQYNNLLAQIEAEKQAMQAQKSELELKCKKFAAKFKVKDREVNKLEEKLRVALENNSANTSAISSEHVSVGAESGAEPRSSSTEQLEKRVSDLQFTATNLDAALQSERERRRELESEIQTLLRFKSTNLSLSGESDPEVGSGYALHMHDTHGSGDRSVMSVAKRFIARQRHLLTRGPRKARYKRIAVVIYLLTIHFVLIKMCLLE